MKAGSPGGSRTGMNTRGFPALSQDRGEVRVATVTSGSPNGVRGVDLAIRGLLATFKDDQEVLVQGMVLFDGLYAALSDRP